MLTRFDDYPIHQTAEPIAQVATSDRNAYDRYWFNGYAADGEFYFGIALGSYPNRRIMDCASSTANTMRMMETSAVKSVKPFAVPRIEQLKE